MISEIRSDRLAALTLIPLVFVILVVFIAIKCSRCSVSCGKERYNPTGRFSRRKPKERTTGSSADGAKSETRVELNQLPPAHLQV